MISNEVSSELAKWGAPDGHAGFRETYERMVRSGELASFRFVRPVATAATHGEEASRAELLREAETTRPDVVLVVTPKAFGHEQAWIKRLLRSCGEPVVLYLEHDPWHRWAKPITRSMRGWLEAADVVFTVARQPHIALFRRAGAQDVRFVPHTYCHVAFGGAEAADPLSVIYDAVFIGSRFAHWGRVSRLPGAVQRAKMVRTLQRCHDLRVAVYGGGLGRGGNQGGWSGRGAKGVLPFDQQVSAIQEGLISVNWDHFPQHESYASDRLPISLLAGRVHVTTEHPRSDWLPGEDAGVFLEPSVSALVRRVQSLAAVSAEDLLAMGAAGHRWVSGRLSHREAARFLLAAIDKRLLAGLPAKPWHGLASEWPE